LAESVDDPKIGGELNDKVAYADDIMKTNSVEHHLQADTDELVSGIEAFGMILNTAKTKVILVSSNPATLTVRITIKGEPVRKFDFFVYLSSLTTPYNDHSKSQFLKFI